MGESAIEWTRYTFNPWWGCVEVSPGCANCYAKAWAKRTGHKVWGPLAPRRWFGDDHWREPIAWARKAARDGVRERVFCASMADVFELVNATRPRQAQLAIRMDMARQRLWTLIAQTPELDWLLLTKRPQHVDVLVPTEWLDRWPRHVWLGVTAEDQQRADERLPILARLGGALDIPITFVSYEPALELVDFRPWMLSIDWLIVGGESGPGARPFDPAWARQAVADARSAGTAAFVKQLGARPEGIVSLRRGKHEDPKDWPADLRVREVPRRSAA